MSAEEAVASLGFDSLFPPGLFGPSDIFGKDDGGSAIFEEHFLGLPSPFEIFGSLPFPVAQVKQPAGWIFSSWTGTAPASLRLAADTPLRL